MANSASANNLDIFPEDLVQGTNDFHSITETVCGIIEAPKPPKAWYVIFGTALALLGVLGAMIVYLVTTGVGIWGNNQPDARIGVPPGAAQSTPQCGRT